jgi:hypothetical protein
MIRQIAVLVVLCSAPFGCYGRCGKVEEVSIDTAFELPGDVWRADLDETTNDAGARSRACQEWAGSDTGRFEVSACEFAPTADTGDSGAVRVACTGTGVERCRRRVCE